MLLLLGASVASWAFIIERSRALNFARSEMKKFEDKFWSGVDLNQFYKELAARQSLEGMASMFCSGFKEFVRSRKNVSTPADAVMEGASRAMRVSLSREALIATAMGLFAAIPAVIAYNRFSHQVEKLENSYGNFMEEFSSILHRQALSSGENTSRSARPTV